MPDVQLIGKVQHLKVEHAACEYSCKEAQIISFYLSCFVTESERYKNCITQDRKKTGDVEVKALDGDKELPQ